MSDEQDSNKGDLVSASNRNLSIKSSSLVKRGLSLVDCSLKPIGPQPIGEILCFKGHSAEVTCVAISPDGRFAVSGSLDKTIRLWSIENGQELRQFTGFKGDVKTITVSPNGNLILSGCGYGSYIDNVVYLWNVEEGCELRRFEGHDEGTGIHCVAFSPDGKLALSAGWDDYIRIWNVESGYEIRCFKLEIETAELPHGSYLTTFSPDGSRILCATSDRFFYDDYDDFLELWDIEHGCIICWLGCYGIPEASSITLSPDNRRALYGMYEDFNLANIALIDLENKKIVCELEGHKDTVNSLIFSPDGERALSGSSDKSVRLWDVENKREVYCFEGHTDSVTSVAFSPDNSLGLSGSKDCTVRLWRLPK
jgi:WD40 repeat protein